MHTLICKVMLSVQSIAMNVQTRSMQIFEAFQNTSTNTKTQMKYKHKHKYCVKIIAMNVQTGSMQIHPTSALASQKFGKTQLPNASSQEQRWMCWTRLPPRVEDVPGITIYVKYCLKKWSQHMGSGGKDISDLCLARA